MAGMTSRNRRKTAMVLLLATTAVCVMQQTALAGNRTWSIASDGAWEDPSNWDGGGVPLLADTALFTADGSYTVSLNLDAYINNLNVDAGDLRLDLGGNTLEVRNDSGLSSDTTMYVSGCDLTLLNGTLHNHRQVIFDDARVFLQNATLEATGIWGMEYQNSLQITGNGTIHGRIHAPSVQNFVDPVSFIKLDGDMTIRYDDVGGSNDWSWAGSVDAGNHTLSFDYTAANDWPPPRSASVYIQHALTLDGGAINCNQMFQAEKFTGWGTISADQGISLIGATMTGDLTLNGGLFAATFFNTIVVGNHRLCVTSTKNQQAGHVHVGEATVVLAGGVAEAPNGWELAKFDFFGHPLESGGFSGYGLIYGPLYVGLNDPARTDFDSSFVPTGPLHLSEGVDVGSRVLRVLSDAPVELVGGLTLDGGNVHADCGLVLNGSQTITGRGIVVGPITGTNLASGIVGTSQLQFPDPMTITNEEWTLVSGGPAIIGEAFTLAGAIVHAPSGVTLGSAGIIAGEGKIIGPISGSMGTITTNGGTLELGDATRSDGFVFGGDVYVDHRLIVHASGAATLGGTTTLSNGVLEAPKGIQLDGSTTITGQGTILGPITGSNAVAGLVPSAEFTLSTPLTVGSYLTTFLTQTRANIASDLTMTGATLTATAPEICVLAGGTISGFGQINTPLTNLGTVRASSGALVFNADASGPGAYIADADATLQVSAGTFTLGPGTSLSGPGDFVVYGGDAVFQNGASHTLSGNTIVKWGDFQIASGATYDIAAPTAVTGGHLLVNGVYQPSGPTTISDGSADLYGSYTATGTTLIDGGTLNLYSPYAAVGGTTIHAGQVVAQSGGSFAPAGQSSITGGLLHLTSGSTYSPAGLVNLSDGTLQFDTGGTPNVAIAQTGGTVTGSDDLLIPAGRQYDMSGGHIEGPGALAISGQLNLLPGALTLDRSITNNGAIHLDGATAFRGTGGSLLNVGSFTATAGSFYLPVSNQDLISVQHGSPVWFIGDVINDNTINVSRGTASFKNLTNNNVIAVDTSGDLHVTGEFTQSGGGFIALTNGNFGTSGGGHIDGQVIVDAGSAFVVDGGQLFMHDEAGQLTGTGTLAFAGGNLTLYTPPTPTFAHALQFQGGSVTLPSATHVTYGNNVTLNAGELINLPSDILAGRTLLWTGGTIPSTLDINPGATLAVRPTGQGGTVSHLNGQVNNSGTVRFETSPTVIYTPDPNHDDQGTTTYYVADLGGTGTFNNLAAGAIVVTAPQYSPVTATGRFAALVHNAGTFTATVGNGNTARFGEIDNSGLLALQSGRLQADFYMQTAGQTVLAGGSLGSNATMLILGGTLGGTGIVDAAVTNRGTIQVQTTALTITGDLFNDVGGQLNVAGPLTVGSTTTLNANRGNILIDGAGGDIFTTAGPTLLETYYTNLSGASLTLRNYTFSFPSGFSNAGTLTFGTRANVGLSTDIANSNLINVQDGAALNWTSGSVSGSGSTRIGPGSTLAIAGAQSKVSSYQTFTNEGSILWQEPNNSWYLYQTTIDNHALFDIQNDHSFSDQGGNLFHNQPGATLRKSSAGTTTFNLPLNNEGVVDVQNGTMQVTGGGTNTDATFHVGSGASLDFYSNFTFAGETQFTGDAAHLRAGTQSVTGTLHALNLDISGAELNVTGTHEIRPGDLVTFQSGAIDGTGSTIIRGGGTFAITGNQSKQTITHTFTNEGSMLWQEPNNSWYLYQTTIDNHALFDIQNSHSFSNQGGDLFQNRAGATLQKSSDGITNFNIPLINKGLVDVQAGTMQITGGGTNTDAAFHVGSGASLDFYSNFTLAGDTQFTGDAAHLRAGTQSVTGTLHALNLDINGAELNVTGTHEVRSGDLATFQSGAIDGTGSTIIRSGGTFAITGSNGKQTTAHTFTNEGSMLWQEPNNSWYLNNTTIDNYALFDIQSSHSFSSQGGNLFQNRAGATLQKSSDGTTDFNIPLINDGLVDVQAGTMRITGGGTNTDATFHVASGASLDFYSNFTFAGDTQFTGDAVHLRAGTQSVTGTLHALNLDINGAELTVTGSHEVRSGDLVTFQYGYIDGAGSTIIRSGGTFAIAGTNEKQTITHTFTNEGSILWQEPNNSWYLYQTTIDNHALFDIQSSHSFSSQGGNLFQNRAGAILQKSSDGTTDFNIPLNNEGLVDVQVGTMRITGGGTNTDATFHVGSGASLDFYSNFAFAGDTQFTGDTIHLRANTQSVTGTLHALNLDINGAELNVTGTHEIRSGDVVTFQNGYIDGTGSTIVRSGGTFTITGNQSKQTITHTFTNEGSMLWQEPNNSWYLYQTTIDNHALFDIQSSHSFSNQGGNLFHNRAGATLRKTSPGDSYFNLPLDNAGTIRVENGNLHLYSDFSQTAGAIDLAGGNINLDSPVTLAGGVVTGAGTITGSLTNAGATLSPGHSPGTITILGDYTQQPGGSLVLEIGGYDPATWDRLIVSNTAHLGGSLSISFINGFVPAEGDAFPLISCGSSIGTFDKVLAGPSDSIAVQATYTPDGVMIGVISVPEPAVCMLLGVCGAALLRRRTRRTR